MKGAGGVLPIPAAATQAGAAANVTNAKPPAPQSRLKVVIRRLAPGLTQHEFEKALGEEWMPGKGRVEWILFRLGKVSKDLAKPSRPSRVYLQVTAPLHLDLLAEKLRQTSFVDARNSSSDTVLLGPPMLEFAPYGRVPLTKKRNDPRQGLVDQDPEFIAFLESLTNPIVKPTATEVDGDGADLKKAKITVTPLIQHLRDKKAAKEVAKEKSTAAKAAKSARQPTKNDIRDVKPNGDDAAPVTKDAPPSPEKKHAKTAKVERTPKLVARPVKGETTTPQPKAHPPISQPKTQIVSQPAKTNSVQPLPAVETPKHPPASSAKKPESDNPGVAAARMLQRDLGLRGRGGIGRRGGRQINDPVRPPATTPATSAISAASPGTPGAAIQSIGESKPSNVATPEYQPISTITPTTTPPAATASAPETSPVIVKPPIAPAIMRRGAPPRGLAPAAGLRTSGRPAVGPTSTGAPANAAPPTSNPLNAVTTPGTPTTAPAMSPSLPSIPPSLPPMIYTRHNPVPSTTSTQAFLKHANPSQGVTEALLSSAMEAFGPVARVEIDKRKGFAYVDFEKPEGLQKAMAASPIKIAQGNVQVLERKDRMSSVPPKPPIGPAVAAGRGVPPVAPSSSLPGVARGGPLLARGGGMVGFNAQSPFRGARGSMRGRGGIARGASTVASIIPPATSITQQQTPQVASQAPAAVSEAPVVSDGLSNAAGEDQTAAAPQSAEITASQSHAPTEEVKLPVPAPHSAEPTSAQMHPPTEEVKVPVPTSEAASPSVAPSSEISLAKEDVV